jgi:NAD-dependent oxidoreductase involved in siderophore biosynthesis
MTSEQAAIREAYSALCDHQSPSNTEEQKQMALVRCWQILAAAVQAPKPSPARRNNWHDGEERELG